MSYQVLIHMRTLSHDGRGDTTSATSQIIEFPSPAGLAEISRSMARLEDDMDHQGIVVSWTIIHPPGTV